MNKSEKKSKSVINLDMKYAYKINVDLKNQRIFQ